MDEPLTPEQDRDALAAELALGLLDGDARAEAQRLRLSDRGFAAQVAAWEARFAGLADDVAAVTPPKELWDGIAARLPAVERVVSLETRLNRWRMAALGSGALAAALALVLLTRPDAAPLPAAQAPELAVARIEGDSAATVVRARYDGSEGVMLLRIEGLTPGELAPELWVIPAGGAPVSLGQIAPSGTARLTMDADMRALVKDGATLAITLEPVSPVPHAAPSSAPIAAGKITII